MLDAVALEVLLEEVGAFIVQYINPKFKTSVLQVGDEMFVCSV